MNLRILVIISAVVLTTFSSCSDDDETILGNWVGKEYFGGIARADGTSFSIGGKGYFGMGHDADEYFTDFWVYDPDKDVFVQVGDLPETAVARAYNISVNTETKGYMGLGYDGDNDLADVWEYDAASDTWTQISDYPGGARISAAAFTIGDDVYIGTGTSDNDKVYNNDFYKYSNGSWSVINFGGNKRKYANATSLDGKGYIIGGSRSGTLTDMWEYDPTTDKWTPLDKLTDEDTGDSGLPRYNAICYAAAGKIYLIGGQGSSSAGDAYEWDPSSMNWTTKNTFESGMYSRQGCGVFVIDEKGYFVGGRTGSTYFDDCYMFDPDAELDSDD